MRGPWPRCHDRTMSATTAPGSRVEPLLRRYLDMLSAEKNLSRYTVRNYAADLQHLLGYLAERDADPLGITRPLFRTYLASMIEAGVAQGSIVRRVSTARSFYRWLRLAGHMADDPLANVALPKKPRRLPRALSLGDVTSVIVAADGEKPSELRDRALLEVMYGAGVRVSEAAALDLGHVDLRQMSLLVHGKGNKERLVVIGEPARDAIERYLQIRSKLAKGPRHGVLPEPGRRPPLAAAHTARRPQIRAQGRARCARPPAPAAPHLRHAPARWRRGAARRAGVDGPRQPQHHADLSACHRRAAA